MSVSANSIGSNDVIVTVCKNASAGNSLSSPTSFTVTLTASPPMLSASYYDSSLDFAAGDFINVYVEPPGGVTDLAIQLDLF